MTTEMQVFMTLIAAICSFLLVGMVAFKIDSELRNRRKEERESYADLDANPWANQ